MIGLLQAGAFFGSIDINIVADRWERKMSIAIPSFLVLISRVCLAGSVNVGMFIAFRFFNDAYDALGWVRCLLFHIE
jgi:MFS family permease